MKGSLLVSLVTLTLLSGTEGQSKQIWTIAIGHEWGAHEYIDASGYMAGFGLDLIDLVCGEARMDCRVSRDKWDNCWKSNPGDHPSGARGLMGRWYDACSSWYPTVERSHTYQFTQSHFKTYKSYFYTLKGERFNPADVTGKRLGFVKGWAYSEKCVARDSSIRGYTYSESNTFFYDTPTDTIKALQADEVDAVFLNDVDWTPEQMELLDKLASKPVECLLGGNGMMSRKDSAFTASWNVGFSKLLDSNKFTKFCERTNKKHKHKGAPLMCV